MSRLFASSVLLLNPCNTDREVDNKVRIHVPKSRRSGVINKKLIFDSSRKRKIRLLLGVRSHYLSERQIKSFTQNFEHARVLLSNLHTLTKIHTWHTCTFLFCA
jgi:hypothetical protein